MPRRKSEQILIDADAFVALNDPKDANRNKALEVASFLSAKNAPLLTSNFAYGEAITVISQNAGLKKAAEFIEKFDTESIAVIETDEKLRLAGEEIFKAQTSKNIRFTDCINMAIMKDLGIDTIFSFDKHYKKNGFKRLGFEN